MDRVIPEQVDNDVTVRGMARGAALARRDGDELLVGPHLDCRAVIGLPPAEANDLIVGGPVVERVLGGMEDIDPSPSRTKSSKATCTGRGHGAPPWMSL